jgi:hypothetical protein
MVAGDYQPMPLTSIITVATEFLVGTPYSATTKVESVEIHRMRNQPVERDEKATSHPVCAGAVKANVTTRSVDQKTRFIISYSSSNLRLTSGCPAMLM